MLDFESTFGALPPAGLLAEQQNCSGQGYGTDFGCYPINDSLGRDAPNHSWLVLILPFLGEQELFDQFDLNSPIFDHPNDPQEASPLVLPCPGNLKSAPLYDSNMSGAQNPANGSGKVFGRGNFAAIISPVHVDHQLFFQGALGGFQPGDALGQPLKKITDPLRTTLVVTEVRKSPFDWDHRGVWTVPWPASTVLAADVHHAGTATNLELVPNYVPDPDNSLPQLPNNQLADVGDSLFKCLPLQAFKIGMPCTNLTSFMSAAPRSLHPGGVTASALDCSVRFLSNDIDVGFYSSLIYTRTGTRRQIDGT